MLRRFRPELNRISQFRRAAVAAPAPGDLVPLLDASAGIDGVAGIENFGFILARDCSVQDVVNTVAETTVFTFSVPANTLGSDRRLILSLQGDFLNNMGSSQNNPALRVKFGGTVFFLDTLNIYTYGTSATRYGWFGEFEISAAGATNAQTAKGHMLVHNIGAGVSGVAQTGALRSGIHSGGAVDSTANQTLEVTIQNNAANANYSTRLLTAHLELR